jgi:acetoin utilization protein AcuB
MRVKDVMTRQVETVSIDDAALNAREKMKSHRIRHLVVLDGKDVAGVVSSRDLDAMGLSPGGPQVEDVMTYPAMAVGPDATIRRAANLLRGRTMGCLPVMDEGKLVGILTTTDILELIGRGAERPAARATRRVIKGRGPRRKLIAR